MLHSGTIDWLKDTQKTGQQRMCRTCRAHSSRSCQLQLRVTEMTCSHMNQRDPSSANSWRTGHRFQPLPRSIGAQLLQSNAFVAPQAWLKSCFLVSFLWQQQQPWSVPAGPLRPDCRPDRDEKHHPTKHPTKQPSRIQHARKWSPEHDARALKSLSISPASIGSAARSGIERQVT